jgi:hypothetical protein
VEYDEGYMMPVFGAPRPEVMDLGVVDLPADSESDDVRSQAWLRVESALRRAGLDDRPLGVLLAYHPRNSDTPYRDVIAAAQALRRVGVQAVYLHGVSAPVAEEDR